MSLNLVLFLALIAITNCDNATVARGSRDVYFPGRYGSGRSHQNCDTTITQKEGWISSPNFPSNYDNSIYCTFFIVKSSDDVCQIEVTFTDFDVEDTPNCVNDYLEIGVESGGRLCGVLLSESKKKISFPQNDNIIRIFFRSDAINNRKGFMARVLQLRNSCVRREADLIPNNSFGEERTPSAIYLGSFCDIFIGDIVGDLRPPLALDGNHSCVYTIKRAASDVCRVDLIFQEFDLGLRDNRRFYTECDERYVELPDRERLCTKLPFHRRSYYYSQTSDYIIIHFKNNHKYTHKQLTKFWIEVRQVRQSCDRITPNTRKCDQTISRQVSQVIRSPNYPRYYDPSQQCVYTLLPIDDRVCEFELSFDRFSVESSSNYTRKCFKDFLYLPDGTTICGSQTGKRTFFFPKFRDRVSMFYFSSDTSIEDRGFEITVRQYPNSCYHNHGVATNSLYPTTRHIPPPTQSPQRPDIQSSSCDKITTQEFDIITSPNYPSNYPSLSRCIYTILKSSPNVCQIRLEILALDIEYTTGCNNDHLLVETTAERMCGVFDKPQQRTVNYPNFSGEIRLIFNSDRQTTRPGFELRVNQIANSCNNPVSNQNPNQNQNKNQNPNQNPSFIPEEGTQFTKSCGTTSAIVSIFQSDNYPFPYNLNTDCVYRVTRANIQVCRLEIYFDDFEVGFEDNTNNRRICSDDYLEIEGTRYCGRKKGERFMVNFAYDKQDINFKFHTNSVDHFAGFRIQVRQVDDKCRNSANNDFSTGSTEACNKMTISEKTLQILSPNYDRTGTYRPFLDCEYNIRKFNFDVCALEVKYNAFSLEDSKSCQKDYLQIGTMRLCGKLPYDAVRTYEFAEDVLTIKFHTDSDVNDSGFVILIKQIQC